MPTIVDDAICIRHWDFSETSQTVGLLCRAHGLLRGLAKGAKRERGRFSGGIDLLTRGEVVAIVKPGRELATLTDWDLQETYPWLRRRLIANRAGFYLSELVLRMLTDADPHPVLYDRLVESLAALRETDAVERTVGRFQWVLLDETGYRPRLDPPEGADSAATVAFGASEGGIVADDGSPGRWRVRAETVAALRRLDTEGVLDGDEVTVARATRLLAAYIREIIGAEPATMRPLLGSVAPRGGGPS